MLRCIACIRKSAVERQSKASHAASKLSRQAVLWGRLDVVLLAVPAYGDSCISMHELSTVVSEAF
jgi:hypothetical protein